MDLSKKGIIHVADGKHLSKFLYPKTQEGREIMNLIPNALANQSVMYYMLCTHSDIISPKVH